jgi:1-aminocyclopropane-1-carboxylate deaminase
MNTPLELVAQHPGNSSGIRLFVKRDDLVHPTIQGNKWRKLALILDRVVWKKIPGIISFGGPFSNHLHALAIAGCEFGIHTVGIVRGEHTDLQNATLKIATAHGMTLFRVSKTAYDAGPSAPEIQAIITQYPDHEILPEGAATVEGVYGCIKIGRSIRQAFVRNDAIKYAAIPAGTGTTAAGMIAGLAGYAESVVFPAAAYGIDHDVIQNWLNAVKSEQHSPFHLVTDYIMGKFAQPAPEIIEFAHRFERETHIRLDPIYNSRMMFGLFDLLDKGYFPEQSIVIAVHTGGLQGWNGR